MAQDKVWDKEYLNQKFLTNKNEPQTDVLRFVKYLKKQFKNNTDANNSKSFEESCVLDLGSGTGRNSFYFAQQGSKVLGFEISKVAISIAEKNLSEASMSRVPLDISYVRQSIGEKFPCDDLSQDIVLDVTSSNSLTENERETFLLEVSRVLKNDGYFFTKALCKDGDENAKYLLKNFPGKEADTYIMPETQIVERVWSKEDFIKTYERFFQILYLEKKTTYTKINNRSYKRNFWIAYMKK